MLHLGYTLCSGRDFLGPIKTRLSREINSNNVEFGVILASYTVNNTWTPLVAGILVTSLGTARASLVATGLIFGGQIILLFGRWMKSVGIMAAGLFTFGLGISPISVVQVCERKYRFIRFTTHKMHRKQSSSGSSPRTP